MFGLARDLGGNVREFNAPAGHSWGKWVESRPRVLLLQGPVGPFFRRLQSTLNSQGFDAWHVRFNAADRVFGTQTKSINFDNSLDEFRPWLSAILSEGNFDVVVLFGCARPLHTVARAVCEESHIDVLCLEEGYVRPGFVTIEEGGNNAASPIACRLPSADTDDDLPLPSGAVSSFSKMAFYGFWYFVIHGLFSNPRERRLFHKPDRARLLSEAYCWIRNAARKRANADRSHKLVEHLLEHHDNQYYIVPLQVSDDSQMVSSAGRGWTNSLIALRVMESFARHAPKDHRLVFKVHPLDRGHFDANSAIVRSAQLLGIEDRVDLVDQGSLGLLTRHARGMITVNSTSGFSAIHHGTPVAVLGSAMYAHPDIAYVVERQSDIDRFWTEAVPADASVRQRYLKWMRANSLAYGDFYLDGEVEKAIEAIRDRCSRLVADRASAKVVRLDTGSETKVPAYA